MGPETVIFHRARRSGVVACRHRRAQLSSCCWRRLWVDGTTYQSTEAGRPQHRKRGGDQERNGDELKPGAEAPSPGRWIRWSRLHAQWP